MINAITANKALNDANGHEALSRRCPKCRSEQIAEEKKSNEPMLCEKCETEIPPQIFAAQEAKLMNEQSNKNRSGRPAWMRRETFDSKPR